MESSSEFLEKMIANHIPGRLRNRFRPQSLKGEAEMNPAGITGHQDAGAEMNPAGITGHQDARADPHPSSRGPRSMIEMVDPSGVVFRVRADSDTWRGRVGALSQPAGQD